MAEYIDRDALKDRMADFVPLFIDESNKAYVDGLTDAYTLICQAPAACVVERKTGKWEVDEVGCGICSVCGNYAFETTTHHISGWYPRFCPNCGAKMEAPTDV